MLREDELIELGFEKVEVPVEESGNEQDYYYYTHRLGQGCAFISSDSTESEKKDKWYVMEHDLGVRVDDYEDLEIFLSMFKRWKKI